MYDCEFHYDSASSTPQLASSTCAISTSTPPLIATSSDIVLVPSMTTGEVLIALFLFVQILMTLAGFVFHALDRIQTKRKVMGYGGGDVEIRDDI